MFELDPPVQAGWNDVRNMWPGCLVLLKIAAFFVVSSATFGWDFIRTESTLEAEILASISSLHVLYTGNKKSGCSFGMNFTFNLLSRDIHREIILTDLPYIFIVLGEFVRRSIESNFPLVIILLTLITSTLACILIL